MLHAKQKEKLAFQVATEFWLGFKYTSQAFLWGLLQKPHTRFKEKKAKPHLKYYQPNPIKSSPNYQSVLKRKRTLTS